MSKITNKDNVASAKRVGDHLYLFGWTSAVTRTSAPSG